jgi:hypothetical protein
MSDYDHESLVRANKYLPGSVEEEHERTKVDFVKMPPAQRIETMKSWQAAIEDDGRVTRGTAQLFRQLRELESLHWSLVKVSR